jgi:hypothetical protein
MTTSLSLFDSPPSAYEARIGCETTPAEGPLESRIEGSPKSPIEGLFSFKNNEGKCLINSNFRMEGRPRIKS